MTPRRMRAAAWAGVALVLLVTLGSLGLAGLQLAKHRAGHVAVSSIALPDLPESAVRGAPPDLTAITALAPFGRDAAPAAAETPRAPGALRNVALRGVLLAPGGAGSRAVLAVEAAVGVYRTGDAVASATLVAIDTETVTLRQGGAEIVVGFDGPLGGPPGRPPGTADPALSSAGGTGDAPDGRADDPFSRLAAAIVPGRGSIDLRAAPPPETTEDYIDLWRDRIARNPQDAMDRVGVERVARGYRVKPDPDIGVTLAGLRPGDVITGLNGRPVGDPDRDRVLYDEVAAAGIARVEVERDGRAMLLTFPLR